MKNDNAVGYMCYHKKNVNELIHFLRLRNPDFPTEKQQMFGVSDDEVVTKSPEILKVTNVYKVA